LSLIVLIVSVVDWFSLQFIVFHCHSQQPSNRPARAISPTNRPAHAIRSTVQRGRSVEPTPHPYVCNLPLTPALK